MKSWKRLTQNEYIARANIVHNNYYDYSKTIFTTVNNKLEITCPKHGSFWQNAANHLNGNKCKKCSMEQRSAARTKTTEEFIKAANKLHSNKYSYQKTIYTKSSNKVIITCPIHGDFVQIANLHSRGAGCPDCALLHPANSWSFTEWEKYGLKSKNFIGFSLYILECWNDEEHFIKVGKTFTAIEKRYDYAALMPYSYKIVYRIEGSANYISHLEYDIHRLFKNDKQFPQIPFKGGTECYPLTFLSTIYTYIENYDVKTANKSTNT